MRYLCGCAVRAFSFFFGSYGSRDAAGLVPVPLLFVYALSELHIVLAHMCVRTYWDM